MHVVIYKLPPAITKKIEIMNKSIIVLLVLFSIGIHSATNAQTATIPDYVPQDGLVARYPFNGNAIDATGNGNDGVVFGASLTQDQAGISNRAYAFNGVEGQIYTTQTVDIFNSDFTINLWYSTEDLQKRLQIFFNTNPHAIIGIGYSGVYCEGAVCTLIGDGEGWVSDWVVHASAPIEIGIWNMITVTRLGDQYRFYTNGILDAERNLSINADLTSSLSFGSSSFDSTEEVLKGKLDNIAFWNRALTDTEISAIYNEEVTWPRDTTTEVVDVVNPVTGKTWMDRNLGASRAATSSTDSEAYGDLYQWGRAADGHEKRTSGITSTLSTTDQPGHGDFITNSSSPYDWRSPQNDNLWQGVEGVNNPCPVGYRLPTEAEWNAERGSWSSNNSAGAYGSPLKLPAAGYRDTGDGSLFNVGSYGYYWSSSVDGAPARFLLFYSSDADVYSFNRADGNSVRCRKD